MNTQKNPTPIRQEEAHQRWEGLKNYLWLIHYSRPYSTSEIMFGDNGSMERLRKQGYSYIVRASSSGSTLGIQRAEIKDVRRLTFDEFVDYYNLVVE